MSVDAGAPGDARMRIAVVSRRVRPAHPPGGNERHVGDLVTWLARSGVEVDLYCEAPEDPVRATAAAASFPHGVATHWIPGGWLPIGRRRGTIVLDRITNYPAWTLRVGRWMNDAVDLVHVHGAAGWGVARAHGSRLDAPIVYTPHGLEEFATSGLKHLAYAPLRAMARRIAAECARVIATDDVLVEPTIARLRVPPERVAMIPNAIDPDECEAAADTEAARSWLPGGAEARAGPLFISVGRIAPNKGFDVLAEALGAASSSLPSGWRWVLVGDGPYRGRVERAISRAGIGDRCRIAGAVDDGLAQGLLASASWFVHPTRYEGSSLVTLEAMAHRRPVLATRAGGLPDKVIEGETGFLVPPGDVDALAAGLLRASADRDAAAMGVAGRELLERRFAWRVVAPRIIDLYRAVIEAERVRQGSSAMR